VGTGEVELMTAATEIATHIEALLSEGVAYAHIANTSALLFAKHVLKLEIDPLKLPPVIGLAGPIGAGKTTAARALGSLGYRQASFATPLKQVCFQVFGPLGVPREAFFGTQEEKSAPLEAIKKYATGRQILELVGTEGFRAAYPDVWLDLAMVPRYEGERIVIDDVRYENEATAIRSRGGLVLHLERLGAEVERTGHRSDAGLKMQAGDEIIRVKDGDVPGLQAAAQFAAADEAVCSIH
jgi:hypothetical protein